MMSYFDRQPQHFRFLALSVIVLLSAFTGISIYNYASSPTDENWFRDPPSRFYVTNELPARAKHSFREKSRKDLRSETQDSIRVGDLLISINDAYFKSPQEIEAALNAISDSADVMVEVFRPQADRFYDYVVPRAELNGVFYRLLPPVAYVYEVIADGASDRAGMKVGDLIFRINGKDFRSSNEADLILRNVQIGKTILYEVIRDNESVSLNVTLARFGLPIHVFLFFVAGVIYMMFGSFLLLKRPQIKAARLVGSFFLCVGYFLAVVQARREVDVTAFVYLRNMFGVLGIFFGVAFVFRSGTFFPRERPEMLQRKWVALVHYALAGIGASLVGLTNNAFFFNVILVQIAFAVFVSVKYRRERSDEYRKLSRAIMWSGWIAALAGMSMIPSLRVFATNQQILVVALIMLMVPFAYLYTIGRYRLLDLDLRVRRNIQYTLVSIVWGLLAAIALVKIVVSLPSLHVVLPNIVVTGTSIEVTDAPPSSEQQQFVRHIFDMALAVIAFTAMWWLRKKGQEVIDRKYYRTQYDYRRAATELAEVLSTKLSMVELGRGIVEKLAELMRLKRVGVLFFRDEKSCCCQEAHGFGGGEWKSFCVSNEAALLEAVRKFQGAFRIEYLPPDLKEKFHANKFWYLIPIHSKDKLVGTLLVGEKLSESPFHQDDFAFLMSAANQAALSIENAFLYEELAEKERMKHELEIARRIQLESLPQNTPSVAGLEISGSSLPAMEVGGDFFDYLNGSPEKLTVIVGDVSGKGTSAALYMSKVQGIFRSLHEFNLTPKELFIRANRLLCRDLEKRSFVTVLGATFDVAHRSVSFARAGHLPLLFYRASDRRVEMITPKGLGLGLNDEKLFLEELQQRELQYEEGDVVLFMTDGVTEAQRKDGEQFGEERVIDILHRAAGESADSIRTKILNEVRAFVGDNTQHDDETVVVVKSILHNR